MCNKTRGLYFWPFTISWIDQIKTCLNASMSQASLRLCLRIEALKNADAKVCIANSLFIGNETCAIQWAQEKVESGQSLSLVHIWSRWTWADRRETRKGTWVYSCLKTCPGVYWKNKLTRFNFHFWLIWISCTKWPTWAQTIRTWEYAWTGIKKNEGWMKKQRQRAGLISREIVCRQKNEGKKI